MVPYVFFVLFNSNHQVALRIDAVYHGTAAICISIELYEIVQLRAGNGVAMPLIVVGLTLMGGLLIIRSLTHGHSYWLCSFQLVI